MPIKNLYKTEWWLPALALFFGLGTVSAATLGYPVEMNVIPQVGAKIQYAVPEGRVGSPSTNWDSNFYLAVRTADDSDNVVLSTMNNLATTTTSGERLTTVILDNITAGVYDVTFKGHQHLSKKLNDINLNEAVNILNFSQIDNSAPLGTEVLLAGDVNGDGTTPATLGDDTVNSVDLSLLLGRLDVEDPTARAERTNLNQDPVVNSVDLSLLIKNLDAEGDR